MNRSNNPRIAALEAISRVLDRSSNLTEAFADLNTRDHSSAAFSRHLAYGVLRWLSALDWLAGKLLQKPLKHRDRDIHRLILLGLLQLWKDESARHAAVNETAECARKIGKPWAVGLINAVLRRFLREKTVLLDELANVTDRFAHPDWLVSTLQSDWPGDWQNILEANNQQAGLWLRTNQAITDPESVCKVLEKAGFETRHHEIASNAIEVSPPAPVERIPGFSDGHWSVQDPAAQLATTWLDLQPGQSVLDACAAPGGKTCHILESSSDTQVTALDRSQARLRRLQDNAARLGFSESDRLTVIVSDALDTDQWWDNKPFDRILLDAPCTATGIIRRHPEIKWLRDPSQVRESARLQAALLECLWPLLKPGGILVYSTCSVLNAENCEQISHFIEKHDDATPASPELSYGRRSGHGCQVLPGEFEMDGFFYARLRKET